ncbi:MAG: MFS transporter, partial [Streptomyces sp.]
NSGMAGGAVNTFRQLGYAVGVAGFGTVLTSRMQESLGHDAAHTVAGGGASAVRGTLSEHAVRAAFASGLNTAAVVAGVVGLVAGAAVLVMVRSARRTPEAKIPAPAERILEGQSQP